MLATFKRSVIALVVIAAVMGLFVIYPQPASAQLPAVQILANLLDRARSEISQRIGISPDRLTIINQSFLGNTGITRFKLVDPENNIYDISLDANGNPLSQEALEQAIRAVENELSGFVGKLEGELAARIAQGSDDPIRVIIRLRREATPPSRPVRGIEDEANRNLRNSRIATIQQPLVDLLTANGQQVIFRSSIVPIVIAAVTPSLIQTIAERSDVVRISLEREGTPRANISRVVVQADTVNGRGYTGSGTSGGYC